MAGTPLSEIYDLFMQEITDYKLVTLFNTSETDFENYLQAWLTFSIVEFKVCDQSLVYDNLTKLFTEVLKPENKVILAMLMMKYWLQKLVRDVTQLNLHVGDRDFKLPSEAQNLKEKTAHLITVREECSQLLNDYGFARVNWAQWDAQIFGGA
jgi:hypothetical protein